MVVVGQVLVDLVGDHDQVVAPGDLRDGRELRRVEHAPGRVVRAVEQDEAGAVGDRFGEVAGFEAIVGCAQGHRASYTARELDHRAVAVVVRLAHDDLVARVDQAEHRCGDGLGGTGGDHHVFRGEVEAVVTLLVADDRLDELGRPVAGWVLVATGLHGVVRRVHDRRRPAQVREALAEIDRPGAGGEGRHLGEDRAADAAEAFSRPRVASGPGCAHEVEPNCWWGTCGLPPSTTMAGCLPPCPDHDA